tara:strand:+ start:231 stop:587 length:357 start_codon:yes stop_codon:yes gene_type:complete
MAEGKRENFVEISLDEYEELKAQIPDPDEEKVSGKPWWQAPDERGWIWVAPEYFSRWRLFPRAFISMYIYLLFEVVTWFMALPTPGAEQAGLVSVIVGAGAAWFGLYVNSTSTDFKKE